MKKVGTCFYTHKTNLSELFDNIKESSSAFFKAHVRLEYIFPLCIEDVYEVIKYDTKTGYISFINVIGWDELYEPIVGTSYCFNSNGVLIRKIKGNNKVYHHKWMFVDEENYKGFDIEDSKQRSKQYESIEEIMNNKSRIGNLDYWTSIMRKYNLKERMI